MARNGSGVYSLPAGSTITNGDTSDATDVNTPLQDIAADLNIVRPIVAGGTGASSAAAALTALGAQAADAGLLSIAGLTTAADRMIYTTASDTYAVTPITAAGRALVDDADVSQMRTTLGVVIGTNVQAYDADLAAISALSGTGVLSRTGAGTYAERTITSTGGTVTITNPGGVAGNINLEAVARPLLATKTASASATLDFTEFNNGLYRRYEFELDSVLPATDNVALWVRTSTNAGSSYDSGASDYGYAMTDKGSGAESDSTDSLAAAQIIIAAGVGNAAGEQGVSGIVTLWGAPTAARATVRTVLHSFDSVDGSVQVVHGAGVRLASQDTDAIRFLFSSGNITSGTIRMFGIV